MINEQEITDNYKHLPWKYFDKVEELRAGAMVQLVESHQYPLMWRWHILSMEDIKRIGTNPEELKYVRVSEEMIAKRRTQEEEGTSAKKPF